MAPRGSTGQPTPTCAGEVCQQSDVTSDHVSPHISSSTRQHGDPLHTRDSVGQGSNTTKVQAVFPPGGGEAASGDQGQSKHQPPTTRIGGRAATELGHHTESAPHIDFNRIRKLCEGDVNYRECMDLRPGLFAEHRRREWPGVSAATLPDGYTRIYQAVRATGLPNAMAARVPLPTRLNVETWKRELGQSGAYAQLLDFIQFGFPVGYLGPISDTRGVDNHPSATDFPRHIQAFINKEIGIGGVLGPFESPPFTPWCHVSPLMSRPKSDPTARRVITDMTYPAHDSINAYVIKNGVYGLEMPHSLPTVDKLVEQLKQVGPGAYLATLDIARAYKNFNSDPIDWPLLCFEWQGAYFCDVTVPFGARASSLHMQSVANAIVDILASKGIKSYMYLDDLIILSTDREQARRHFETARALLKDLGLPEAADKVQEPAQEVKWLGVNINTANMTLSIPEDKVNEALEKVSRVATARSISRKHLQSIVGQLLHVAKCVKPARLFVSRLLEALRGGNGKFIRGNADMRADFRWLIEFCTSWNGLAYIAPSAPARDIYVDACLSGIGATDGTRAYAGQVANVDDGAANITELEALNVVVALQSFLGEKDRGTHIRIHCDNHAAVHVLQTGRGRNRLLLDCARAAWMVQAVLDVELSYVHVPGIDNREADLLSRAHLSSKDYSLACKMASQCALHIVQPCLYAFDNLPTPIISRSGGTIVPGQSSRQATQSTSTRHHREPEIVSGSLHSLRQEGGVRPVQPLPFYGLRVHRVPRRSHPGAGHHKQQNLTRKIVHQVSRGKPSPLQPPQGDSGHGGPAQEQTVRPQAQTSSTNRGHKVGHVQYPYNHSWGGHQGGNSAYVLWRAPPVRSGPPHGASVRPVQTPNQEGHYHQRERYLSKCEVGKEHAENWTEQGGRDGSIPHPTTLPSQNNGGSFRPHPQSIIVKPPLCVSNNGRPHPRLRNSTDLGHNPDSTRVLPQTVLTTLPQEICRNTGTQGRLW